MAVVREIVRVQGGFLEKRRDNRFLKGRKKVAGAEREINNVVIVGMRIEEHSLRSQVGKGSEWDCLLGQLNRILDISDSVAGQKVEK